MDKIFLKIVVISSISVFLMSFLVIPVYVYAGNIVVDPMIIDHQGMPRGIIKGSFKITNPSPHKTTVFTVTKNCDPAKGEQSFSGPSEADLGNSLANWI